MFINAGSKVKISVKLQIKIYNDNLIKLSSISIEYAKQK